MPDIVREHSQRRPLAATGLLEAVGFMGPLQVALHFIAIGADFRRSCLWDKSDAPSLYFCSCEPHIHIYENLHGIQERGAIQFLEY